MFIIISRCCIFIETSNCHAKYWRGFQIFSARLFRNYDQTSLYLPHISLTFCTAIISYRNMQLSSDHYGSELFCNQIIKMKNIFLAWFYMFNDASYATERNYFTRLSDTCYREVIFIDVTCINILWFMENRFYVLSM